MSTFVVLALLCLGLTTVQCKPTKKHTDWICEEFVSITM